MPQRLLMAFVMVLAWSRKLFFRFFLDAKMPSFLRGHEAAFRAFGGCPRVLLYDNLKSARASPAVSRRPRSAPLSLRARSGEQAEAIPAWPPGVPPAR